MATPHVGPASPPPEPALMSAPPPPPPARHSLNANHHGGSAFSVGGPSGFFSSPPDGLDDHSNNMLPTQEHVSELMLKYGKIFHDKIHDQMRLPGALVAVIDTPEFQRLRNLHQLGSTQYLFPSATHTRFEHSLGVAHLAMKMLRSLKTMHDSFPPRIDITEQDLLCVGLAGLCHDLGHGPLSHMFEDFVNHARHRRNVNATEWCHEEASEKLFDHLIVANELDMGQFGLLEHDLRFVKSLIRGLKPSAPWPSNIGRNPDKRFLYDIVANKRNGIDVDKLDYFLRDSLSCFGRLPDVLVERIFSCARVIECDGEYQICFEEKVALTLTDLFYLRAKLHKFVYQHRVTKVVDDMMTQALLAADDHFLLETADNGRIRLSDCVDHPSAYAKLGDWVLGAINATEKPELQPARAIIQNIHQRKLYKMVGGISDMAISAGELRSQVLLHITDHTVRKTVIDTDSLCVLKSKIIYGSSGEEGGNPLRNVRFYNPKRDMNFARKFSTTKMSTLFSPQKYSESVCMVFCRNTEHQGVIVEAFEAWKRSYKAPNSATGEVQEMVGANACSPFRAQSRKRQRESSQPMVHPNGDRGGFPPGSNTRIDEMTGASMTSIPEEDQ